MKVLIAFFLMLMSSSAFAVSYSFQDLRNGISENIAIDAARREGLVVSADPRGGGYLLANPSTNDIVGMLWVCSGSLYGYSLSVAGGENSFVKRVAKFGEEFGIPGVASSTSKVLAPGEVNTIEITWEKGGRVITLSYTPRSTGFAESQWVRYSVPGNCRTK